MTTNSASVANDAYAALFEPISIGSLQLSNRLFSPGHGNGLAERNTPGDDYIAYQAARARGGISLIITEIAQVEDRAIYSPQALRIVSDDQIPGYRRFAETLHAEGTAALVQLFHPGGVGHKQPDGRLPVAWAPSEVPTDVSFTMPRPMSVAQIEQTVDQFAAAARRLCTAGIDGVEIVATHGLLPSQFLNPSVNLRTDDYGGSFEKRLRFLRDVIAAIRNQTGDRFTVGIRISGDEGHDRGLDLETVTQICATLDTDDAGNRLDYFNIASGSVSTHAGTISVIPPMGGDHPVVADYASAIRNVVTKPVLVAGRINHMAEAAAIVSGGKADMVGMVRANICDPEITNKTREGRIEDIRVCIGCNQTCMGHRESGASISCLQNPVTGRELRFSEHRPAKAPRRVLVAGGGPAGMQAAVTAAARGHHVTLYEQATCLGGQVLLAERLPGRSEFGGIVSNLMREIELNRVTVLTNTPVSRGLVVEVSPDVVIVATGARPYCPAVEGEESAHIVDAWSVLRGEANVGARVVVADWASNWVGLGLAEMLARDGCSVRLAVNAQMAGEQLQSYVRARWVGELHKLGVEIVPYARLFGADENTVYFQHAASREPIIMEEVDTLVTALGHVGHRDLEYALEGVDVELHTIGDCQAARTAEEAILEGMEVSMAI